MYFNSESEARGRQTKRNLDGWVRNHTPTYGGLPRVKGGNEPLEPILKPS